MGLKDILKKLGKGAAAAGLIAGEGLGVDIGNALKAAGLLKDPAAEAKARELLAEVEKELVKAESAVIASVNASYQKELQFGNWWQRSWRPMLGWSFAAYIINNYIVLAWFPHLPSIELPPHILVALGAAIGITAWGRSQEKLERIKNGGRG